MVDFTEKVAIITGISRGLGKVINDKLSMKGAIIVATDSMSTDVSYYYDVSFFFDDFKSRYGKLDILVNNAGVTLLKPMIEFTEEEYDRIIDTNLKGTFFCSQEAMKIMKSQGFGTIINIASTAGVTGGTVAGQSVYAASKAAIICLTKTMAREMAPYNVRVNCVAPSLVNTGISESYTDEQILKLRDNCPMKRLGTGEEVANVVAFLASDLASYITGQTIYITGGSYM